MLAAARNEAYPPIHNYEINSTQARDLENESKEMKGKKRGYVCTRVGA